MNGKREILLAFLTLAVILSIVAITSLVINDTNTMMSEYCFEELDRTATSLASELKYIIDSDSTALGAMARLIASQADILSPDTIEIMQAISSDSTYISCVEILMPNGVLTNEHGQVALAAGHLDFSEEVKKGKHISGKEYSPFDGEAIMRSAVPIVKNGETVAMLYGIVGLKRLVEVYKTDIYNGKAYVYIVDGETGDFLLDTWHKSLGNIYEMGGRQTTTGEDIQTMVQKLKNLESGDIGFISKTTGGILYMRFEPIGVNKLSVMLTVEEDVALAQMRSISDNLFKMTVLDGLILLVYMILVVIGMFGAYKVVKRIGLEDMMTVLQNRIAYDKYVHESQSRLFESVACIYVDANGLHELNNRFGHDAGDQMLKTIAEALKRTFSPKCIYRIGGDEFVVITTDFGIEACEKKIAEANEYIKKREYSVSMGLSWRENELGLNRVIQEADERMLANKRKYYETHERRGV